MEQSTLWRQGDYLCMWRANVSNGRFPVQVTSAFRDSQTQADCCLSGPGSHDSETAGIEQYLGRLISIFVLRALSAPSSRTIFTGRKHRTGR